MALRHVLNVVGLLLLFVALAMLLAAGVSALHGEREWRAFLVSAAVTASIGGLAWRLTAVEGDIRAREGYAIVTLAWLGTGILGGLPFLLSGVIESPVAAVFESMSGFTTTGATVLSAIEGLPHGILFWRSLTHWLGGMGIIVLVIAVLPFLGVGGMQLYKAEVPGPIPERLRPRMTQTAKILWLVYVGLTAAQTLLYLIGGMSLFDAVNHSFSTLATGGFSTKDASIAAFDSRFIQYVTIVFMYAAGINFALHFRAAANPALYLRDAEWRFVTALIIGSGLALAAANLVGGVFPADGAGLEEAVRSGLFQAATIVTTTGFVSADYSLWVPASQGILFVLLFTGGMAGSTSGGPKAMRIMLLLKQSAIELRRQLHPRAVLLPRVGRRVVSEEVLSKVLGFLGLYLLLLLAGVLLLSMLGIDLLTALGASAATVGNIGPGIGAVGPVDNYGWMPPAALGILSFLMLVGRLEIFTVLLLFHPEAWRGRGAARGRPRQEEREGGAVPKKGGNGAPIGARAGGRARSFGGGRGEGLSP